MALVPASSRSDAPAGAAGGALAGSYPNPTLANLPQAAIADVPTGALVLLSDVITAIGQIRTALNTLLAELRTAGVLLP